MKWLFGVKFPKNKDSASKPWSSGRGVISVSNWDVSSTLYSTIEGLACFFVFLALICSCFSKYYFAPNSLFMFLISSSEALSLSSIDWMADYRLEFLPFSLISFLLLLVLSSLNCFCNLDCICMLSPWAILSGCFFNFEEPRLFLLLDYRGAFYF